jgi:hypothetical protein
MKSTANLLNDKLRRWKSLEERIPWEYILPSSEGHPI